MEPVVDSHGIASRIPWIRHGPTVRRTSQLPVLPDPASAPVIRLCFKPMSPPSIPDFHRPSLRIHRQAIAHNDLNPAESPTRQAFPTRRPRRPPSLGDSPRHYLHSKPENNSASAKTTFTTRFFTLPAPLPLRSHTAF
ncbi:hypothetical protein BGLA2_1040002 [Burkholderia gladioli]|nr:hypothetical protein BGLA2_1040002 [Burkholderia gladioli]